MSQVNRAKPDRLAQRARTEMDGMAIKSYYAGSVEEAVDRATHEMGSDAMLVDSRRAPAEARHMGEYEVRFAVPSSARQENPLKGGSSRAERELALEVAHMRAELTEVRQMMRRKPKHRPEPALDRLAATLMDTGFSPQLAREIAAAVRRPEGAAAASGSALSEFLEAELRGRIGEVFAGSPVREPAAVAFIGPPGYGKTTALIKAALRRSAAGQPPAVIVNTDAFRIGSSEQMARYASILGLPLFTADTPGGLRQLMETRAGRTLLIDTPGLSGGDIELFEQTGYFLAGCEAVERHLVLPATMHWADLARAHRRYERFRPTHLLFTHLDETDRFGGLITATCQARLPVSWVSAGQKIPDDLEAATPESLARLILANPLFASMAGNEERIAS